MPRDNQKTTYDGCLSYTLEKCRSTKYLLRNLANTENLSTINTWTDSPRRNFWSCKSQFKKLKFEFYWFLLKSLIFLFWQLIWISTVEFGSKKVVFREKIHRIKLTAKNNIFYIQSRKYFRILSQNRLMTIKLLNLCYLDPKSLLRNPHLDPFKALKYHPLSIGF